MAYSHVFSCAWHRLHVFAMTYDWFIGFVSASIEGCPILRQIYAWHCIVLTSDHNTIQKHNNKEQSKTIRNLTMPCIDLSECWTSVKVDNMTIVFIYLIFYFISFAKSISKRASKIKLSQQDKIRCFTFVKTLSKRTYLTKYSIVCELTYSKTYYTTSSSEKSHEWVFAKGAVAHCNIFLSFLIHVFSETVMLKSNCISLSNQHP